jgi:predicted Holliday junction resolvase-like endonuclease
MKSDILHLFNLQRQIFGVCPHCDDLFRLSDTKIYVKKKPVKDWMDELDLRMERLDRLEEKIEEKREELQEKAREKGRKAAQLKVKRLDPIFTPRRLNPDDAKVIFHPIDYIVFNGMKNEDPMTNVILLARKVKEGSHNMLQKSIVRVLEHENYEWQTLRVQEDGRIKAE